MELYARAFEAAGALHRLEGFASFFGADFYGLPRNTGRISLQRAPWTVPESYAFGEGALKPLCAGEVLQWKLAHADN
jgi:dihydroorotase